MIKDIKPSDKNPGIAIIELLDGYKHEFQDGDHIKIEEVIGMEESGIAEEREMQIDSSSVKKEEPVLTSINGG